jgi:uncharacterized delta-60 repeat protein
VLERDASDRYVLLGQFGDGNPEYDLVLARYLADGTPDGSFGSAGTRTIDVVDYDLIEQRMDVAPDGTVLISIIEGFSTSPEPLVVRLDPTGTTFELFDPTWPAPPDGVPDVMGQAYVGFQPDGGFLMAASSIFGNGPMHVMRIDASGAPDATYGTSGVASIRMERAGRLRSDPGELLVAADGTWFTEGSPLGGVAKWTVSGAPDPSFGDGGVATVNLRFNGSTPGTTNQHLAFSGGGVALAGTTASGYAEVLRYTASGVLDVTFGVNGVRVIASSDRTVDDLAVDSTGNLYVLHSSTSAATNTSLTRLTASGAVDGTFGAGGTLDLGIVGKGQALEVDGLDRVVVAIDIGGQTQLLRVAGTALDGSYLNPVGDTAADLIAAADGSVFVRRSLSTPTPLERYDATGASVFTSTVQYVAIAPDGNGKLLTIRNQFTTVFHHVLERLNADGTPDVGFGSHALLGMSPSPFASMRRTTRFCSVTPSSAHPPVSAPRGCR